MATLIRLAHPQDAAALVTIYAPAVRDRATSFELEPPDDAEMARRVARAVRTPWLVCEHAGKCIGYAYASAHRERPAYQWSVEVSAYVRPEMHRVGVGRGLYTALFAVLTLQGFRNAYAGVALPNPASVALHESVGFTSIGVYRRVGYKLGAWHDVAWFECSLADHSVDPSPPIPISTLPTDPHLITPFASALAAGLPLVRCADLDP